MTPEETAALLERRRQEGEEERDRVAMAWKLATFWADYYSRGRLGAGNILRCEGHEGPAPLMLTPVRDDDEGPLVRLCWFCTTKRLIAAGARASEASRLRTRGG